MAGKENKVLWISQEEAMEIGAGDLNWVMNNVIRANKMLGRGETIEIPLFHMMWQEGKHAGKRIGLHACILNSDEENVHVAGVKEIPSNPTNPRKLGSPVPTAWWSCLMRRPAIRWPWWTTPLSAGIRTGCGSGLGAKCFAREDSEVMGLVAAASSPDTACRPL